jgi:hypothetical protein
MPVPKTYKIETANKTVFVKATNTKAAVIDSGLNPSYIIKITEIK